jgi:hypothetical protein
LPEQFAILWHDFFDLHNTRTSNGYGVNPISYTEIDAWVRLTGNDLTSEECRLIKIIDTIYLNVTAEAQKEKR